VPSTGYQISGKTFTVLGAGAIGKRIAGALRAMEAEVLEIGRRNVAELDRSLARSHGLLVAAPLTEETRDMVDLERLKQMLWPRLVVNVGRGAVVKEDDFYDAIREGVVGGAGIDVWYRYASDDGGPVFPSRLPFYELEAVVMSPHRAGTVEQSESDRAIALADLLVRLRDGLPVEPASAAMGY
jgi:phosphoglycerate dehydrogenase-like enzyme